VGYGAMAGMGLQALMQLAGESSAGMSRAEQLKLLRELMEEYRNVPLPELERLTGEELGPSALEGVGGDPALRDAQLAALGELQDVYRSGGLSLGDEAALSKVLGQSSRQEGRQRARLSEDFAARGQLGSGAQLAMALQGQQATAQRGRDEALERAAMAQKRSMDAILQRGRIAGEVRGQDYGEKARAAEARDAIARYNAASREKAKYYNSGLGQQQFNNRLARLSGSQGATNNLANFHGQGAQDARSAGAGYGRALYEGGRTFDSWRNTGGGQKRDANNDPYDSEPDEWANPYGYRR